MVPRSWQRFHTMHASQQLYACVTHMVGVVARQTCPKASSFSNQHQHIKAHQLTRKRLPKNSAPSRPRTASSASRGSSYSTNAKAGVPGREVTCSHSRCARVCACGNVGVGVGMRVSVAWRCAGRGVNTQKSTGVSNICRGADASARIRLQGVQITPTPTGVCRTSIPRCSRTYEIMTHVLVSQQQMQPLALLPVFPRPRQARHAYAQAE